MNDKFLGWAFGTAAMAACCIGVPLLVGFLIGTGVFAWFAGNALWVFALVLIVAAIALFRRDRKKRRHLETRRAQAVEHSVANKAWSSVPRRRHRYPET